jgi:hypothetical protein
MNPEDRLSSMFHRRLDNARPSAGLEERIVDRIAAVDRPRGRPHVALAAVLGLGVVLVLVPLVVGGLAWLSESNSPSPSGSATPSVSPSASPTPAPSAWPSSSVWVTADGLAHYSGYGLAFDYPASWQSHELDQGTPMFKEIASFGSGEVEVVVSLLSVAAGPHQSGAAIDPDDPAGIQNGQAYTTIGGLPAIQEPTQRSGIRLGYGYPSLRWTLSVPGKVADRFAVYVTIGLPAAPSIEDQVEALVASIRYEPPVSAPDASDGPGIAAGALNQLRAESDAYSCFPNESGTSSTSVVTRLPALPDLRKALPVACSAQIEPWVTGIWKMTLTESWTAAEDRASGTYVTVVWIDADGAVWLPPPLEEVPSDVPYWP